ncbi:MAG: hypothetical protein DME26_21760, partial [Verrucomicrobia bacterium]
IVDEFERNQISGEDVKVLQAIRSVLGKLSEKDMERVVNMLREARELRDPIDSKKRAADAYSGQKTIITQLRQLLLEYQRQHALYELSLRLKELATRQTSNMRLGVDLARGVRGGTIGDLDETRRLSLQLQDTEQGAVKDEVGLVLGKLEKLAREGDIGVTAERPKAAVQQAKEGMLLPTLETAVEELKAAKILSAVGNEKKARDVMREMARLLAQAYDPLEALRQAIKELDEAIEQQRQVMAETKEIKNKNDVPPAENKQAEVVDAADLVRNDVASLAPNAAEHIKGSIDKMQQAREILGGAQDPNQKSRAAPFRQQEAINGLQDARRALEEQLAKAETEKPKPESALATLKDLQQEVRELIEQEEKIKTASAESESKPPELKAHAPKQGEVKDKTQEVQQRAAGTAPDAAGSLADAANQMDKAQKALSDFRNAPEAQQAALDALRKAEQQLAQQLSKLEEAERQLAQLEDLLKKLTAIIEQQQKVQFDTAKAEAKPEAAPLKNLAGEQDQLGKSTGDLQKEASPQVPKAGSYLGDAKGEMGSAKSKLDETDAKAAQPPQTKALANLHLAKRELESKIEDLKNMLGLPPADMQALADAAAQIEKAQREVNQAMSQMAPPGLMESLLQQQQQIADALGEINEPGRPASPPTKQAHQAAAKAAQQLGDSNLKSAISSMQKAQDAMGQGMSGQPGQSGEPGQGGQNGQGGQKGQSSQSLPQLSRKQAEVKKLAEQLMAAQESAPPAALDAAAKSLGEASEDIGPLTAGQMGPLPRGAQSALQQAQGALSKATAQASAHNGPSAQANSSDAAEALAQAQAALALAQAGLGSQQAMVSGQGQGQKPGQGQGRSQSQQPGQGRGQPNAQSNGNRGNWDAAGGADGPQRGTTGNSQFLGLPKRDRAAIQQSQSEKYPQEYGSLVEQYLKNLSDEPVGAK